MKLAGPSIAVVRDKTADPFIVTYRMSGRQFIEVGD